MQASKYCGLQIENGFRFQNITFTYVLEQTCEQHKSQNVTLFVTISPKRKSEESNHYCNSEVQKCVNQTGQVYCKFIEVFALVLKPHQFTSE